MLAGICPIESFRHAEFLANEVPGVRVPQEVVERMRRAEASGAEAAREEGVQIALEVIAAVRPVAQGVHLNAPRRDVAVALRVLREAGVGVGA